MFALDAPSTPPGEVLKTPPRERRQPAGIGGQRPGAELLRHPHEQSFSHFISIRPSGR
jgi:hypothetical protein